MDITVTDILVLVVVFSSFVKGWQKGIFRTLLGPGILVLCTLAAVLYYRETNNLLTSLIIGIIGPVVLGAVFAIVLKFREKRDSKKEALTWVNELLGGLFGMVWGGLLAILCVAVVGVLPRLPSLAKIQNDVTRSAAYRWVKSQMPEEETPLESVTASLDIANDPELLERIQDTDEMRALQEHETIQEILADEETMKQIENRNFVKLLSNPKIAAILNDKELMKKFLSLNVKIAQEKAAMKESSSSPSSPEDPQPLY